MAITRRVLFIFLLLLTPFLVCKTARGWYEREYVIQLQSDGSGTWIIEHGFRLETEEDKTMFERYRSDTYFTHSFIKDVKDVVNRTEQQTGRNMDVENFEITVSYFDSYRVVKYQFDWVGFSNRSDTQIIISDIFQSEGLFFLGDGTLEITYPPRYVVETVSPTPSVDSDQTLSWETVTDFETGQPRVILKVKNQGVMDVLKGNLPLVIGLITLIGIGSATVWFYKVRKKEVVGAPSVPEVTFEIQDDEEKVVNLLKSAGGRLYQSTITDRLEFSKSKTSRLLTVMEDTGRIKREKKGRQKLVTLMEDN
ncbi:MAG: helix-turn-helix transcriptional regulator [Thermoproteota archaeon]